MTEQHTAIRNIFMREQAVLYRLPLGVMERNDACVGKHLRIKDELEKLGYTVRWAEGTYHWDDLPIPKEILEIPHEDPAYHVWLEVKMEDEWKTLDATWDPGLAGVLPVNRWEDFGRMQPAVPIISMTPYKEVIVTREPPPGYEMHLQRERPFHEAINAWLEQIRHNVR